MVRAVHEVALYSKIYVRYNALLGTAAARWLRRCATNQKVVG